MNMSVDICRLCGKDNVLLNSVFEKDYEGLWFKIDVCFGVQIRKEDIFQKICKTCYFFVNTVYEFRLTTHNLNNKLKTQFSSFQEISYPSQEISQNAFLNSLNLTSKSNTLLIETGYHPSVLNLKRKYPNIRFPEACNKLNLDPTVRIEQSKFLKLSEEDLGVWSLKTSANKGNDSNLIFTRLRTKRILSKRNFNEINDNVQSSSSPFSRKKRKRLRRYRSWTNIKKKCKQLPKAFHQKKVYFSNKAVRNKKVVEPPSSVKDVTRSATRAQMVKSREDLVPLAVLVNQNDKSEIITTNVDSDTLLPKQASDNLPCKELDNNLLVVVSDEVRAFICQTCNKIFDTLEELTNHKRYNHKSSLRCSKCCRRFAIVEELVRHNLEKHPEMNESNQTENARNVSCFFARKSTTGLSETIILSCEEELVISSDDDVEVTHTLPEHNLNHDESTVLQNQTENPILLAALSPTSQNNSECNVGPSTSTSAENDSAPKNCYVISSDEETKRNNSQNTSKTVKKKLKKTFEQQILVIPSDEDKCTGEEKASNNAKITNEITYVNYIFNKCSYSDKNTSKRDQWWLEGVQEYLKSNYLPVNVSVSENDNVSMNYVVCISKNYAEKTPFWKNMPVVDLPVSAKNKFKEFESLKVLKQKESLKVLKPKINFPIVKVLSDQSNLNPNNLLFVHPNPETGTNIINNQKIITIHSGNTQAGNVANVTKVLQTKNNEESLSISNQYAQAGANIVISNEKISTNIQSENTQTGLAKDMPEIGMTLPVEKINNDAPKLTQIVKPQMNNMQHLKIQTGSTIAGSDSSNVAFVNQNQTIKPQSALEVGSQIPQPASIIIPSVLVKSSSNQSKRIINLNAVINNVQQNKKLPIKKSPCLQLVKAKLGEQQQGYVLMEVPADKTESNNVIISSIENSNISKQPIVLNGLPYPTYAKIKTITPGQTVLLQQIGQQTNLNIQNCINICQQEVTSVATINEQAPACTYTTPATVPQELLTASTSQIQSNTASTIPKPIIRIKNISELTDKPSENNLLHNFYTATLNEYTKNVGQSASSSNEEYIQI